jgi:DNA replication protein DnaC
MSAPAEAACPVCAGAGYAVEQRLGKPARARRCACQAECPRCQETGFVLVARGDAPVAQPCTCRHLDERIRLFCEIGVPAVAAHASFENFKTWSTDHSAARALADGLARKFRPDEPSRGFLLYGRPGGGKTHLLVATLRHLSLERGVAGRYVEFMLLLSDIKAGFAAGKNQMEILRPLLSVPVLAIDELGKERGTEFERSMLDELISRRYSGGLTTLFATNYFPDGPPPSTEAPAPQAAPRRFNTRSADFAREAEAMTLPQRIGDRVFSRLNEMCAFQKLDPGSDYRRDRPGSGGFWGG